MNTYKMNETDKWKHEVLTEKKKKKWNVRGGWRGLEVYYVVNRFNLFDGSDLEMIG
jgi:hypothetical protein